MLASDGISLAFLVKTWQKKLVVLSSLWW